MNPDYARQAARQLAGTCRIGLLAVEAGFITERQLADALDEQERLDPRPRLGELLVLRGWLEPNELETVLRRQAERRGSEGGSPLPAGVLSSGRLGRFDLVESLGEGGSGEVWKAWDPRLARWVALKSLRFPVPAQRERFLREARLTAGIQHPHIVPIHEIGHHDGADFLVLEYKDADSMDRTRLDLREGLRAVRQVCEATAALHARGVVHRDIKPQNILVDRQGNAFLTDLGLARALESEKLTVQGTLLGTPAFMAPEQVRDARGAGTASDIYALGGVLYFIATMRPPAGGATLEAVLDQLLNGELVPPRRLDRTIPRDVETIALKAMERDPRRRYESAQAMADDIGRYLGGESILARPIPAGRRALLWMRRRAIPLAVAAVLAAAGIVSAEVVRRKDAEIARQRRQARIQTEYARELRILAEGLARLERLTYEPLVDAGERDREAAGLRLKAEALEARFPDAADPPVAVARACLIRHEWKAARAPLQRGRRLDPGHREAREAEDRLLLIEWGYWFGRIEDAEVDVVRRREEVDARVRRAAQDGSSPLALALARLVAGDREDLVRICTERIARGGHTEAFQFLLGCAAFAASKFEEAEARCTLALDRAPSMLPALMLRAACRSLRHRADLAEQDADRAIALAPCSPEGLLEKGRLLGVRGDFSGAVAHLQRAIALDPDLVLARGMLAGCLSKAGNFSDSEREFAEALALAPGAPSLLFARAQSRMQQNRLEEALSDLNAAVAADPHFEWALTARARLHLNQHRAAEARADIHRAMATGRASGDAKLLLGRFLIEDRRFEEARNVLKEARDQGCNFQGELADLEAQLPKP